MAEGFIDRLLASIPFIDFFYIGSKRIVRAFPELSYLSRRRLLAGWFEHVLYIALGFICGFIFGFPLSIIVYVVCFSIGFPIEVYIARFVNVPTWEWAKGKRVRDVLPLFGWSALNVTLYFVIGLALSLICIF